MAHDNITPSRAVPPHLCRRAIPNRTGSGDSRGSDPILRRKLRGLRGKSGGAIGDDESFSNFEVSMPDREDKMGSSRSIKSQESTGSSGGDSYGESSFACDSSYAMPKNLKSAASVSTLGSVPESPRSSRIAHPRGSHRGLARRGAAVGMVPVVATQNNNSNFNNNNNNNNNLSGASEHSTTSLSSMGSLLSGASSRLSNASQLSAASNSALERQSLYRNGTRGRSRGLGNKKISTLRITEPGSAPMVSSLGTVAPLAPSLCPLGSSSHSNSSTSSPQRRSSRVDQRGFSAIPRPVLPEAGPDNHARSVAPCSVAASCQSSLSSILSMNDSSRDEIMTHSTSSQNAPGRRDSMGAAARYSMRPPAPASAPATVRSTPTPAVPSQPSHSQAAVAVSPAAVPVPAQAAASTPARVVPAFVREAQELAEKIYEPTEEDWANLYKKHVEVLERKDMEIAMKLSTMPKQVGAYEDHQPTNEDEEIGLALQASANESSQPVVDEEKMLQMVLEMSRNDSALGNRADVNRDVVTNEGHFHGRSQQQPSLTEEEELERVLRMSEQEAQHPLSEEEELERVLRLSQMQQEENSQDDDDELLRVLQMSQKEATEQQRERETMELVLRLSQQGTDGVW
jgi:Ubiquitin interaction motif